MPQEVITLPRQWDLWLKTLTVFGGIAAAIWAIFTYVDTKQRQFYTEYWNRKFALFEETSRAASTLATTSSLEEFRKARKLYFELFFGRLSLVEGDRVKKAMEVFSGLIPMGDSPKLPVQSLEQPAYQLTIELKKELGESWKKPFSELYQGMDRAHGLKPIDKASLQTMVDTTAKKLLIPGAVVVLRTPQGEFTVSCGTTLLGANSPPRADTHFRIASNTKTMTAAVIMLLAQEGKLSLEDPVSKYVPDVPNGDNITITELLNMRSGLYTYDDDPEFSAILERDPTKVWTPAEVLAIAFTHPPYFLPGTAYHYSNTNYALLGLIAEKIDGKPLSQIMHDRLFGPLGLKDTLLPAITSNTLPEPYSHGYLYGGCSFRNLTDKPYPPDIQAAVKVGTLKPDDCTGQNSSYASAAGGVISTANDCATWIKALVGGKVLNADYQRQWLNSLQPEDPSKPEGQKYGYGISQISWGPNTIYFHGGEMPGFNSKISYDPTNKLTLIIWTNLTVSLDGQQTANTLFVKMLDHVYKVSPLR